MTNFLTCPKEKQNHIIEAALSVFGKNGYKKASVNDIASAAGISKAMIFYYFGSKKQMYSYMLEYCEKLIISSIGKNISLDVLDFFDRIKQISDIKIRLMKQNSSIISFLKSAYYETDTEVLGLAKKSVSADWFANESLIFNGVDVTKFKEGIDIHLVLKMLIWIGEGFASEWNSEHINEKMEEFTATYYKCLDIMKENFYKK